MLIQNKTVEEWADKISTKLREANFETVGKKTESNKVVLNVVAYKKINEMQNDDERSVYVSKMNQRIKNILMLRDKDYVTSADKEILILEISLDESTPKVITDMDRLNNKLHKINAKSPYDTHANRFVRTIKDYYDVDMTLDEYDRLCMKKGGRKMKKIYHLNGSVQVCQTVIKGTIAYVIFGSYANHPACFKTALPDLENEETLFPVPDKILAQNMDRLTFTRMVRETLVEKDKQYKQLAIDYANVSDKDLFTTSDLSRLDRIFVKKYKNNGKFELTDAFKFIIQECYKKYNIPNDRTTDLQED